MDIQAIKKEGEKEALKRALKERAGRMKESIAGIIANNSFIHDWERKTRQISCLVEELNIIIQEYKEISKGE